LPVGILGEDFFAAMAANGCLSAQTAQRNSEPLFVQPLLEKPFELAFLAGLYLATRFDNQSAHSFTSQSFMTDLPKDAAYEALTDTFAKARKKSPQVLTESQSTRNLALQSIMQEFQQNYVIDDQEASELLAGKHTRKQDKLTKKAVASWVLESD
jgi:hypothetical protein